MSTAKTRTENDALGGKEIPAGSFIMPGKVNPVIPEAVTQAAMLVISNDQAVALAAANGSLELNPFLPLIAQTLLQNCELLTRVCTMLRVKCVDGIQADEERCRAHVESSTATATALVPKIGYEAVSKLIQQAKEIGRSIRECAIENNYVTREEFEQLTSPEAVMRLGSS